MIHKNIEKIKHMLIHNRFWKKYIEKTILRYYSRHDGSQYAEELEYIKHRGIEVFNYEFADKYTRVKNIIFLDEENGHRYVVNEKGHRLYFAKGMSEERINEYYNGICMEQDPQSPHRYIDESIEEGMYDTILDLGGAEGNFTLSVIDQIKEAYIFECDKEWVEAMNLTFAPWKDKVHIVEKYVSDQTRDGLIKLDDCEWIINKKIDIIKMDIEGEELPALKGAAEILTKNPKCILLVCLYHNADDYENISQYLKAYNKELRKGSLVFIYDAKIAPPYFRYGLMKAYRES